MPLCLFDFIMNENNVISLSRKKFIIISLISIILSLIN